MAGRFRRRAAATVLLMGMTLLVPGTGTAAAAAGPLGKANFVVAIGKVDPRSRENWVRLATYSFSATGEVTESHWHWTQRRHVPRTNTGVRARDCQARECVVRTANGFTAAAPNRLRGRYTVSGETVTITWDGGAGTEKWRIRSTVDGALAALSHESNTFGATHGFGYGSNAAWGTHASPAQLAGTYGTQARAHEYYLWKTRADGTGYIDTSGPNPPLRPAQRPKLCTGGDCVAWTVPPRQGGPCARDQEYYISRATPTAADRRNAYEHWCSKNADDRGEHCYTGNSHVKPMLQVIDDRGGFHGWVGVEASLDQTDDIKATDDDIGVFRNTAV